MDYPSPEQALSFLGGSAEKISRELREFSESVYLLSNGYLDQYANKWVVIYRGSVLATGATPEAAAEQATRQGVPLSNAILRFVSRGPDDFIF